MLYLPLISANYDWTIVIFQTGEYYEMQNWNERLLMGKIHHRHIYSLVYKYLLGSNGKETSFPWWRHDMETLSTFVGLCKRVHRSAVNFHCKVPVMRSLMVFLFFPLNKLLNEQLSNQSFATWCWYKQEFKQWNKNPTMKLLFVTSVPKNILWRFSGQNSQYYM